MTILIENAVVIPDPLEAKFYTDQAVAIDGDEIAAIGTAEALNERYPQAEVLDGKGGFLLPGLIDAHTHLYAALSAGMPESSEPPRTFPQILERVWWQFDKALREDDVAISALVGSVNSLRSGITTIFDHHASPLAVPNSLSWLAEGVEQIGLRACLAYEVSDRDGPVSRDQGINENRRFIREVQRNGHRLLRGMFGLHAVFSLSDETLRRCADEATSLGVGCHMHMAEHHPEVVKFAETHDQSIAEFLREIGLLKSGTLVAHTVHVEERDIRVLVETDTFNVHNPKSNMGNGVGIAPVADMLELGQPVGLGSDGFCDIPVEMDTAKRLQTLRAGDPSAFSDSLALKLVYDHNAQFAERVFDCQLGKIAEGYAADVILVDYRPMTPVREENLAGHIVAALGSGPHTALVGGSVVMKDGNILGIDEAELTERSQAQATEFWARL
jgi:putative selenium metabolism protein SsnA